MLNPDFYAEGNNGGDNIQIKNLDDEKLRLKIGHCCTYSIDAVVPVEFVTAALTKAVDDAGSVEEFIKQLNWSKEYKERLLAKVSAT